MADEKTLSPERERSLLERARELLDRGELPEASALLADLPDSEEVVELRYAVGWEMKEEIDRLAPELEAALEEEEWEAAERFRERLLSLDASSEHERVRRLFQRLDQVQERNRVASEVARKRASAERLVEAEGSSVEDLERAIESSLEEARGADPHDAEVELLLDRAEERRAELLRLGGRLATLEEAEKFDEALAAVKDMLARGIETSQGRNLYEVQAELEANIEAFADRKAAKYIAKAEEVVETQPKLALTHLERAERLEFLPQARREEVEDLRLRAEEAAERRSQAQELVRRANAAVTDDHDHEKAVRLLESALDTFPGLEEAGRHLERARRERAQQSLRRARVALGRARGQLEAGEPGEARDTLRDCAERLGRAQDADGAGEVEREMAEVGAAIEAAERRRRRLETAVEEIGQALEAGELGRARELVDGLDEATRKAPRLQSLRQELARREELDDAVASVQQALSEDDLEGALSQADILYRRARQDDEIKVLYRRVAAQYHYRQGEEALAAGELEDARKSLKKVDRYEGPYLEEAEELLAEVADRLARRRRRDELLAAARQEQEAGRHEAAWQALEELGAAAGSDDRAVKRLRAAVRRGWREQLVSELRDHLKAERYRQAGEVADRLDRVALAADTELISRARLEVAIRRAEEAAASGDHGAALEAYEEAERWGSDRRIDEGAAEAKRLRALQRADAAADPGERVALLQEALDARDPDPEVADRLARALLDVEELDRAAHQAAIWARGGNETLVRAARRLGELCAGLVKARRGFRQGVYADSLADMRRLAQEQPAYAAEVDRMADRMEAAAVEELLTEARRLQNAGERPAVVLPLYREILELAPRHREAQEANRSLLSQLGREVRGLIEDSLALEENANATAEQLEGQIDLVEGVMPVVNREQGQKLEPRLRRLEERRRVVVRFEKRLETIRDHLIAEARESGDFQVLDREVSALTELIPTDNHELSRQAKEVRELKEARQAAERRATDLEHAFDRLDFSIVESLAGISAGPTPKTGFTFSAASTWPIRRATTASRSPSWWSGRAAGAATSRSWTSGCGAAARTSRRWRSAPKRSATWPTRRSRPAAWPTAWRRSRPTSGATPTSSAAPPEAPASPPARQRLDEAARLVDELRRRAERLHAEATDLRERHRKVTDLENRASALINEGDLESARPLVEEGLSLDPRHEQLRHYRRLVDREL